MPLFFPLFIPVCFTCTLPLPPPAFYVWSPYRFSELPPLSKKVLQCRCRTNVANVYEFSNEKMGSKREKKYFFCKLNIKDQCFVQSYIYKDNKNIYKFIKNVK